jgi:hypothetical protein
LLCKERGMSLYRPNNQAEHNAVVGLLQNLKTLNASYFDTYIHIDGILVGTPSSPDSVWLNNWFSYGSGTKLPYTLSWYPGEPNFRDREFCLSLYNNFQLVNIGCTTNMDPIRFMCKRTSSTG